MITGRIKLVPGVDLSNDVHVTRRFRARNRVAQQKYRSRQRERLQEQEEKLAELSEQLAVLTTEKVRASVPLATAYQTACRATCARCLLLEQMRCLT